MSSMNLIQGARFTTVNGLILQVTDIAYSVQTDIAGQEGADFVASRCVGRVSGNNEDLPKNVFLHRASDGMRFKQAGDDSETNYDGEYVAPPVVQQEQLAAVDSSGTPDVGDRFETSNGLVLEVIEVTEKNGEAALASKCVGRTERAPEHVRYRALPHNTFYHSVGTGQRLGSPLREVNSNAIGRYTSTPPYAYQALQSVADIPVPAAARPRSVWDGPIDDGGRA